MPVPVDVEVDGIMSDDVEDMAGASDLEDLEHNELAMQSNVAKGSNAANSNILQCFWGLASVDEEERTSNALALLSHLRTAQSKRKVHATATENPEIRQPGVFTQAPANHVACPYTGARDAE